MNDYVIPSVIFIHNYYYEWLAYYHLKNNANYHFMEKNYRYKLFLELDHTSIHTNEPSDTYP